MKPIFKRFAGAMLAVAVFSAVSSPAYASATDVKPDNWAYNAVQHSLRNNMIMDSAAFNMNSPAPRKDIAYSLFKLINGKNSVPLSSEYTQYVPMDMINYPDLYKNSVQWCVINKIIDGTESEGNFNQRGYKLWFSPESTVTREQTVTLLYRAAEYQGLDTSAPGADVLKSFNDGGLVAEWASAAMSWAVAGGIIEGTGEAELSPHGTLTKGQMAQFMLNYAEFSEKQKAHSSTKAEKNEAVFDENDLSGPWDGAEPISELPIGGYIKDGKRYNKYGVDISSVDGIPTDEEKRALIYINQHRAANGLSPLIWNQAAQVVAETRALEGYACHTTTDASWAHKRPDGESAQYSIGGDWANIGILKTKSTADFIHENAFRNIPYQELWVNGTHITVNNGYDTKKTVQGWIDSPIHNSSLLISETDEIYAAVACSHLPGDLEDYNYNGQIIKFDVNYWYYEAITAY